MRVFSPADPQEAIAVLKSKAKFQGRHIFVWAKDEKQIMLRIKRLRRLPCREIVSGTEVSVHYWCNRG